MTKFFQNIQSNDFVRNVGILIVGSAFAQIIPLIAAPFLTRMYSPEQFGWLAFLLSVVNPLSIFVCGRYEMATMLPKEDSESINLVGVCFAITIFTSVFCFTTIILFKNFFLENFSNSALQHILFYIPPFLFLMGIFVPNNYWLQRKKAFYRIAINKVAQTTSIALISLGLGFFSIKNGLISGYIIGWVIITIFSLYQLFQTGFNYKAINFSAMKSVAKKYADFPVFNSVPAFLFTSAVWIPVIFITGFYSDTEAGFYNLCRQMLLIPTSFVVSAVAQVYYEKISDKIKSRKKIFPDFLKITISLSVISLTMLVILFFYGTEIFELIFGKNWSTSGEYAQIIVFSTALQFVVTPLSVAFPALGKIRMMSAWQIIYFLSILILFFFKGKELISFLIVLTIIESACYFLYYFWMFFTIKSIDKSI